MTSLKRSKSDGVVEFPNVNCLAQTDKAILIEMEDQDEDIWVPQSVVHEDSEVWKKGDVGTLVVSEWWATKRGLV